MASTLWVCKSSTAFLFAVRVDTAELNLPIISAAIDVFVGAVIVVSCCEEDNGSLLISVRSMPTDWGLPPRDRVGNGGSPDVSDDAISLRRGDTDEKGEVMPVVVVVVGTSPESLLEVDMPKGPGDADRDWPPLTLLDMIISPTEVVEVLE